MCESPRRLQHIIPRSPSALLVGAFAGLIAVGTFLLWMPCSHRPGTVSLLDALFTATSAVCVTGLVVVDTGSDYTRLGQIVILLLFQAGGLGVMTFAAIAFQILGKRLSLRAQAALQDSLVQQDIATEFKVVFARMLRLVLIIESVGAAVLFCGMAPSRGAAHAAYSAVFHAVSAFCNAGFSLYSDSLVGLRCNPFVAFAVTILIVLGGFGHLVLTDLWKVVRPNERRERRWVRQLSLHTRVVLTTSGLLVVFGALLLLLFGLTEQEQTWGERVAGALFQSVTARTAGFNTVNIGKLPLASMMLLCLLMFVGGSPGSCAGGIKTTTFTLWLAQLWSWLRGEKWPRLFQRHISNEISRRAILLVGLASSWNLIGLILLLHTETGTPGVGMHDVLFEQFSAFGTVGLSTGLTPKLTVPGRLWIIVTMFVGRLGPLTLVMWMFDRRSSGVRYPEGKVMIG